MVILIRAHQGHQFTIKFAKLDGCFALYDFKLCKRGLNDIEGCCGENFGRNVVAL